MARPRRAARRTVPPRWVLVAAVVVVVGLVALLLAPRAWRDVATTPSTGSGASSPGASSPSTSTPSSTSSPDPSPTEPSGTDDAGAALDACREDVAARDAVLSAAKKGVGHWAEHVGAQLDADAGTVTVARMNAVFARTRLAGPGDVKAYDEAVRRARRTTGPCGPVEGASVEAARGLAACAERKRAQQPVLAAAKAGMTAWRQHLGDMRRDAEGRTSDPEGRWRATYAEAPTTIDAYRRARASFDAPRC